RHRSLIRDAPDYNIGARNPARIGLAHEVLKIIGVPRERAIPYSSEPLLQKGVGRCQPSCIDTLEPARRPEAGLYNDAARRLLLLMPSDSYLVSSGHVRSLADEEIIHCMEGLPVVEGRLGHGDAFGRPLASDLFRHHARQILDGEGQEDTLPS